MTTEQQATPKIPSAFRITYNDSEQMWWLTDHNFGGGEVVPAEIAYGLLAAAEATIEMIPWGDIECRICGDSLDTHDESCPVPLLVAAIAAARPEREEG